MKRKEYISLALTALAHGDPIPLRGTMDYLIYNLNYDLQRLIRSADKHFGIPKEVCLATLPLLK